MLSADIYSPKVLRSTMGSFFHLPIISGYSDEEIVSWLKSKNFNIITTKMDAKNNLYKTEIKGSLALVLGNESQGVSEFYLNNSDMDIFIPMLGKAESLNVAIAGAIIMFELNVAR